MAEWLKAADCKSVLIEYGGSNPPLPTKEKSCKARLFCFVETELRIEIKLDDFEKKRL